MGAGVQARTPASVPYMVEAMIGNPARMAALRVGAAQTGRPTAAMDIAQHVLSAIDAEN